MILTLAAKELKSLFVSPLAWAVLALLQLLLAWIFLGRLDAYTEIAPQLIQLANPPGITEIIVSPIFNAAAMLLLMVTPLLTMRLIAEERRNHTLALLISAPLSVSDIVFGKFLGMLIFLACPVALLLAMSLSLLAGGVLDLGLLFSNLLGLGLLVAAFVALGLYFSCLTAHPAIAAATTLFALMGLWLMDASSNSELFAGVLQQMSPLKHFEQFNRGLIGTFDLAYFFLFITVFLLLAIRRLDSERWS